MLLRLFIVALWSTAGKGLTIWFLFVMFIRVFVTYGILGQVWYLIVSIPDLCCFSYFVVLFLVCCGLTYLFGIAIFILKIS